jgi:hypothetical protein
MILKTIPEIPKEKFGDLRVTYRFAWWPRQVENKLIWLERYKVIHVKSMRARIMFIGHYPIIAPWGWDFVREELIVKRSIIPDFKHTPPPPSTIQ